MTDHGSLIERAERVERRRARMLPILGIFLITQQAAFIGTTGSTGALVRPVDQFRLSAWVVTVVLLTIGLITGGGWFRGKEMRALINDEVTRANRSRALASGFIVSIATGVVCYLVAAFEPTDPRVVAHVIVSTGLAAALIRFGSLERRSQQAGA
jgi:hypothetical protein